MKKSSIALAALLVASLAAGTIVEKYHGNAAACDAVYGAWWFLLLLAATAAGAVFCLIRNKLWRRPALLLLHLSVPVILLGGLLTMTTGQHGSITLQPGVPVSQFTVDEGTPSEHTCTLPYSLTLNEFQVISYPGTMTPMDFESHVSVAGEETVISMNNILKKSGYRFYQEDYDEEGNSVLSVAHDPWGIAITYLGYLLLVAGLVGLLAARRGQFRKLLKGSTLALLLLLGVGAANAAPRTLPRESADRLGQLYILYKGRICPLQTYAKDFTTKLTGKATYEGLTAEQVLAGYLFYFPDWADEPLIRIKGDEARRQLGINGKRASYSDLRAADLRGTLDTHTKELRAAGEKYSLIETLISGKGLKIFPIADSAGTISWYAQNDRLPLSLGDDEYLFVRQQQSYCQELVVTGRYDELNTVLDKTRLFQQRQAASVLPSDRRIGAERLYNSLTTGRWLAMLAITLGLLAFGYAIVLQTRNRRSPRWFTVSTLLFLVLFTSFLAVIFLLRWVVGGHVPMAGGFDSMNLMALAIGIVAIVARRSPLVAPTAMLVMGFCQLVAMMSGSNPPVTSLMPVLNSPLLTLHVTVIMCSYALFFFVAIMSAGGLLAYRNRELVLRIQRIILVMLYPAVALLAVGIIIGALWANISWGNYWSWDPKEVWALITLIVYALALHLRPADRSWRFLLYCLLALLCVAITYFGVNFLLGGIHAYN